jgi:hypothetical protein
LRAPVFFIGVLIIFNALFSSKLPGVCGIFNYIVCGIIPYELTLSGRFTPNLCNDLRLQYQDIGSAMTEYRKRLPAASVWACVNFLNISLIAPLRRYLAACLFFYGGAIFSLFSVDGPGFGKAYKVVKMLSSFLVFACTMVAVFLISSSPSSDTYPTRATTAKDNVNTVGVTVYICLLALVRFGSFPVWRLLQN